MFRAQKREARFLNFNMTQMAPAHKDVQVLFLHNACIPKRAIGTVNSSLYNSAARWVLKLSTYSLISPKVGWQNRCPWCMQVWAYMCAKCVSMCVFAKACAQICIHSQAYVTYSTL